MFGKITKEFQCLEGYKNNSDILKDDIKILKFKKKMKRNPMFRGMGKNCNVWKNKIRILMIGRIKKEI